MNTSPDNQNPPFGFRIEQVLTTGTLGPCPASSAVRPPVNCWVVGDSHDVVVVDAGGGPELTAAAVGGRRVTALICTQGGRTHTSAAVDVAWELCTPILLHPADHALWEAVHGQSRYWRLDHQQRIAVAGEDIEVLHTPHPTAGSVSLYLAGHGAVLTGDTLTPDIAAGSGWTARTHSSSVHALHDLPPDTRVHPGHGDSFLLGEILSPTDRWVRHGA
ncbi:MBL fold metallo-hydrolase [Rhodococcus pyridinivorans]|uniref:MBL fold metallo-hydrolase n=1 Tax=Rhodococcus pyridinivorans TaxID=103816 RepID=UPI0039B56D0D